MNKEFKSGYVTIIGRPNVGKSTLINAIMGEKLLITSNKPQTTRNTIQAILTRDNYQIVFMDTPGLHKPKHKLGEYMVKVAQSTLSQVDVIVFVTTPEEEINISDKYIIDQIKQSKPIKILVINKVDTVNKEKLAKTIENYYNYFKFDEVVPISALKQKNVDELIKVIVDKLPYGPKYFPDEMITDQPERFVVAEIIREKLLHNLQEEVPHGTAVEVITMREDKEKQCVNINATIYCEKESHKSIIIGKGGQMLKKIGQSSRIDIERFLGTKVFLELWVKVKKDWRDSEAILRSLGYK
ncbi:GTPase Era [Thermobrachium celere]|uniref:GTPase Era n=1 Tax=Thermobrachium celere DSM 8682 TaxID=941824 RepID=R7RRT5_9CLOT|nr:GTPase Era [Thermobrachium celere]CDF58061.1 GTP-binding protein Era [Thermobrachium celere DSM 8682]